MFLKYKTRKAVKKIANGAPADQIRSAVVDVVKEAKRQVSRKVSKLDTRLPIKVSISR